MENLLTILVTTYNRSPYIQYLVERLSSYIDRGLRFNVLISDDCSKDDTEQLCLEYQRKYDWLTYYRLEKNSGMDANFKNAYSHCETKYCWLLGDHRYIDFDEMKTLLDELSQEKYDALILKCREEVVYLDKEYTDINTLFRELGFNITNNASCVIPTSFFNEFMYQRFKGTTFLHMGIFIEGIAAKQSFNVKYLSKVEVKNIELEGFSDVGWNNHPFLNFGKYWVNFIFSLTPQIDALNKVYVLKQHNRITGLFDIRPIPRKIIAYGDVFVKSYKEARPYMKYATDKPLWLLDLLILFIPKSVYSFTRRIYKGVKRLVKK